MMASNPITNDSISDSEVKDKNNGPSELSIQISDDEDNQGYIKLWGFTINDLFSLGTSFLKEKEGKAFNLSYKDKTSLVALLKQATHGKFLPEKATPIGYLDVIGKDRRRAWSDLGDMSMKQAKIHFINLLNEICVLFKPFVHAHRFHLDEKEWRQKEEAKRLLEAEFENSETEEEIIGFEEKEKGRQDQQKKLIQEALNKQTFHQFKTYAEQQCPGDPEQQGTLIRQLQEQHYQQYMLQVLNQNLPEPENAHQQQDIASNTEKNGGGPDTLESSESSGDDTDMSPIPAASMWTRKDIQDFKDAIRKEGGDGILKVGHGETVTVRVPTHEDGTCLFWEFATDSFDIAFGVHFEWTKNPDSHVSVHISDSEDANEDDEDDIDPTPCDIEKSISQPDRCPQSIIIPVYRRDCHEEVYAGSHNYPGQGVYLLKFDNSYSLWRSKMLYYRVYYTR